MKPKDRKIKEVYDKIASGFYHIRQQPLTPELEKLASKWKPGKLLDIGCGSANSTLPFAKHNFECYGIDFSNNLLKLAKQYTLKHGVKIKFKKADLKNIPFPKQTFDYVISTGVLHHLDSENKRLKMLEQMKKVLKQSGKFFITIHNRPEFYGSDQYIPWNHHGKIYQRYYHFFSKSELKNLLKKASIKAKIYLDKKQKNICMLGKLIMI